MDPHTSVDSSPPDREEHEVMGADGTASDPNTQGTFYISTIFQLSLQNMKV